eukprot:TRINITY_DN2010_c0_g2_i1.p1 TRINITY_DN2010_c0_g2~~TRINITY_DN2010_c0_g2_i1.p1  ORF type:complete len:791 (+),score=220.16 TRINITY_DN2010_c0_g2_i1:101-2374(+)
MGEGTFKKVYKAYRLSEGVEVAWSEINTTRLSEHEKKAVRREFQLLSELSHPNVLTMFDFWKTDSHVYFITELMSSGSLAEYLPKIQVSKQIIVKFGKQILVGLDYLHTRTPKVIHRDLKCANIFVNGQLGICKIGDLGLASAVINRAISTVGTPEFMPPEMFKNELYDEKVDIYEFGMCLLEMSTGKFPYDECSNVGEIISTVVSGIKPRILDEIEDLSMKAVIEQCLLPANLRPSAAHLLKLPFFGTEIINSVLKPLPLQITSIAYNTDSDMSKAQTKQLNVGSFEVTVKQGIESPSTIEIPLLLRKVTLEYVDNTRLNIELILSIFSIKKKVFFEYSSGMSMRVVIEHLLKSMKEIPEGTPVDDIINKLTPLIAKAFEESNPKLVVSWDRNGKPINSAVCSTELLSEKNVQKEVLVSNEKGNTEAHSPTVANESMFEQTSSEKNLRDQAFDDLIEVLENMKESGTIPATTFIGNVNSESDDLFDELWEVTSPNRKNNAEFKTIVETKEVFVNDNIFSNVRSKRLNANIDLLSVVASETETDAEIDIKDRENFPGPISKPLIDEEALFPLKNYSASEMDLLMFNKHSSKDLDLIMEYKSLVQDNNMRKKSIEESKLSNPLLIDLFKRRNEEIQLFFDQLDEKFAKQYIEICKEVVSNHKNNHSSIEHPSDEKNFVPKKVNPLDLLKSNQTLPLIHKKLPQTIKPQPKANTDFIKKKIVHSSVDLEVPLVLSDTSSTTKDFIEYDSNDEFIDDLFS